MKTRLIPILITLLCAATVSVQSAGAATITVTNTNDSGAGSLRNALAVAKNGDTIDVTGVSGTVLLTSGQLNVDKDVTVSGPGANNLAVDGNGQSRVFYINSGKTVTIDGFIIRNGHSDDGSGIYNSGTKLTLSNCIISGNLADIDGGGIYSYAYDSALTVSNCTISSNSGGGIFNLGTTLTASNCTITSNSLGGIFNFNSALTVSDCIISGNSGVGILNTGENGAATLTVTNSTVSDNSGSGIATGGFDGGATLTITNSTVSSNSGGGISNGAGGGESGDSTVAVSNTTISDNSAGDGAGIYNASSNRSFAGVVVRNSTVSGNSATGNGGGVYNKADNTSSATVETENTIFDAGGSGENIFNDGGTVTSLGYNLSSDDGSGFLTGAGDQINTDPMLGPLQDNGGPTFTHALLPGSPAIDAGDPNFTPPPFFDQRGLGFDRVVNGRIDIGSFELQGPTATPAPTSTPTPTATPTATPTSTPRSLPTPRPHPTVHPRP